MTTQQPADKVALSARRPIRELPRLTWARIFAISIFAFAIDFHWGALGIIILPSQVLKIVGDANKGAALAIVLAPGAFVSLFANPLFGWLSDRTHGRLAAWGRRRPYIMLGTLGNIAALVWMALARDIPSLAIAYMLAQFFSNAAQAPFHALLPDIVPEEQRGLTSGVIGLLFIAGNIGGVIIAGQLVDASKPLPAYEQGLWLSYGIIIVVITLLMLVTLFAVHERVGTTTERPAAGDEQRELKANGAAGPRRPWLSRSLQLTIVGTILATLIAWGIMLLWNTWHLGVQIDGTVQQLVLELIVTVGILRLFDFRPRRDPDFAWVFVTRLVMMLGIYTIQDFLQYYMRDAVHAAHPEQAATLFVILVSLTSLVTAFVAGWFSDHFGRKRLVYASGGLMALVGVVFILTHSYTIVIAAGALFGLGYGAYQSVDWALVADVLPSEQNYARDMGIWNISLSLPQVIAPVLGGPLIDFFAHAGNPVLGFQLLFAMAIVYCVLGTVTVRFIRSVKK